jgi:hypothetical protein
MNLRHTHPRTSPVAFVVNRNLCLDYKLLALLAVVALVALMAQLMAMASTTQHTAMLAWPRAQTALLKLATQRPDAQVRVIVQKVASVRQANTAEQFAQELGGQVIHDSSSGNAFSNVFVVQLSVGRVPELARHAEVEWISPDGPLAGMACGICERQAQ